jgi:serine/threonine protein kinase
MSAAQQTNALGRYTLIASLGEGGMARVYLALMAGPGDFNKLLVVKMLHESMTDQPEFVQMFLDEARLAARLNHPNIVQTHEVGEHGGRIFMAMEYLEGQSLRTVQRRLATHGGLPLGEELRIIAETARGLHYAHELQGYAGEALGVVHRDVSPQNVFVTYGGQVKLLDFGIAKTTEHQSQTAVGVIKGKIEYIAPEQIRGERIDRRADVFALGVMAWEAAAGRRFAAGGADPKGSDVARIHARLVGGEAKLRDVKPDLPERLVEIIERAIALDAENRHPTALVLADELDAFLETQGRKPTARSLAELLVTPFAAERNEVGEMIDQQVKLSKQSGGLKLDRLARLSQSGTPSAGMQVPNLNLTESGAIALNDEHTPVTEASRRIPLAEALVTGHQPAKKKPSRAVAIGLMLAVIGIAAAAALGTRGPAATDTEAKAARPAPAAAPAAAAPSVPTPAPSNVPTAKPAAAPIAPKLRIRVGVQPPNARVTLDGAELEMTFNAELARDGKLHYVEASAEGYTPQRFSIPFDTDRELDIVLVEARPERGHRASRRRDRPEPAPAPVAAPAPAPEPAKPADPYSDDAVQQRRIKRNIDTNDPWAQ